MKIFLLLFTSIFIHTFFLISPDQSSASALKTRTLILATTTSTQDSGLLDVLLPLFEKESGYSVKTIAVGSGQAIKMGERGEADVLLVHSPETEKKFMLEGFGYKRRLVMHNDFVIVGPASDPAKIRSATGTADALKRIAAAGSLFISRGDNSGTHAKEMKLWKSAAIKPDAGRWYQETGLGMGQTLTVAAEKRGYTMTDRATWLALNRRLGLALLLERDHTLLNVYHVIEVNSLKWPRVNSAGAATFADFMTSEKTQQIIKNFGAVKFGTPLFFPDAGKKPSGVGL